jgi:hypothetical protein
VTCTHINLSNLVISSEREAARRAERVRAIKRRRKELSHVAFPQTSEEGPEAEESPPQGEQAPPGNQPLLLDIDHT